MWSPSRNSTVDLLLKIYGVTGQWGAEYTFCLRFFQVTLGAAYRVGMQRSATV